MTTHDLIERAKALRERHDFLCDAYVRGMVDADEVEGVGRAANAAEALAFQHGWVRRGP